tara:strand:- start:388 stop:534 length:147 start_codon:yes stop_codon:yes gene_type:complete
MSKSSSNDAINAKFNGTIHENFEETDVQDSSDEQAEIKIQVTLNSADS